VFDSLLMVLPCIDSIVHSTGPSWLSVFGGMFVIYGVCVYINFRLVLRKKKEFW
jgi:hypothetical protein